MTDFDKIKKHTLILCFSSGHTSAFMTKTILEELKCEPAVRNGIQCHINKYNRYVFVVFNNTSDEDEESLIFVKKCDDYYGFRSIWLQAKIENKKNVGPKAEIVCFETAARSGEVFEEFIIKHGLPQPGKRKCTQVLKTDNTASFMRQQGIKRSDSYQLVGIRIDEPHRHKWEDAKKNRVIWPLTTIYPTTKFEVNYFFNNISPFRLKLKSFGGNCRRCQLKTDRKLMTMEVEVPGIFNSTKYLDKKYENYVPEDHTAKPPIKRYRGYKSIDDIIEDAHLGGFELAKDESINKAVYESEPELDEHEECGESCDAFS